MITIEYFEVETKKTKKIIFESLDSLNWWLMRMFELDYKYFITYVQIES